MSVANSSLLVFAWSWKLGLGAQKHPDLPGGMQCLRALLYRSSLQRPSVWLFYPTAMDGGASWGSESSNREFLDLQLKGSGSAVFSRRWASGPWSMLREYLISEAMAGQGFPTRSLAVVATGKKVYRETVADGAVLTIAKAIT